MKKPLYIVIILYQIYRVILQVACFISCWLKAGYFTFEPLKNSCVKINVRINIDPWSRILYSVCINTLTTSCKVCENSNLGNWSLNCLRNNHHLSECSSPRCHKCSRKHNTLLDFERKSPIKPCRLERTDQSPSKSKSTTCALANVSSEGLLIKNLTSIPRFRFSNKFHNWRHCLLS